MDSLNQIRHKREMSRALADIGALKYKLAVASDAFDRALSLLDTITDNGRMLYTVERRELYADLKLTQKILGDDDAK